ncbi:MAG: branched-chain amino acid aminotransferase [Bacteroidota bacterium]|nr:branched-chain amino acid aminotransferase [Bacteroidota bacterium]
MKINKISSSRIDNVDFNNLLFGRNFSDHMLICHYKNNSWGEPEIKPYSSIPMMPGTQTLHYGQSVFEGMKAFKNQEDEILLFRKNDNFERLNRSAERLSIPAIPEEIFINGLDALLTVDSNWLKKEDNYSLYIRPFIFASSECIKASSATEFTFIIITSPTSAYYENDIDVVVEEHYTRAPKGGVGFTKAAGNYASSFFPTKQANKRGFTQIIWTDALEHKYIEESGTMNIWFRIKDTLYTPELSDSILAGITRKSIIQLARDNGINVVEKKILVSEITEAAKNNQLKEIFGTGTAVTVIPIRSMTYQDNKINLPTIEDRFSSKLKLLLQDIQKGKVVDRYGWTTKVVPITV